MYEYITLEETPKMIKKPRLGRAPLIPPAASQQKKGPVSFQLGRDPAFIEDEFTSTGKNISVQE